MKPSTLLCFLAAAATALAASAAEKFAYRGTLANPDGSPFASARPMDMTFRLYDRETGGTPLWGRKRPVRVETNGTFYVELDDERGSPSDKSLPYDKIAQALASTNGTFWIGLSPDDYSEMKPRQRLASVPCALHAASASKMHDLKAGTLKAKTVHADSATIGDLTVTDTFHAPDGNVELDLSHGGTLTANSLVQLNGGISGIQQFSPLPSSTPRVYIADTLIISQHVSNLQGWGWGCIFVPATDSATATSFDNAGISRCFSFGK